MLIGCDGINSMVAKWLGLQNPVNAGRSAIRGLAIHPEGHGFEPRFHGYFGGGLRFGFIPSDDKSIYWFYTFNPSIFKCKYVTIICSVSKKKKQVLQFD